MNNIQSVSGRIVMLEDDHDRLTRFFAILQKHLPGVELRNWRSAHEWIAAEPDTMNPILIALDHDLFVDSPTDPDPGDGRDAARYLADRQPVCPVLIHSTNHAAADSMLFTLLDAGWNAQRISPIGGDWIEAYWFATVVEILNAASTSD